MMGFRFEAGSLQDFTPGKTPAKLIVQLELGHWDTDILKDPARHFSPRLSPTACKARNFDTTIALIHGLLYRPALLTLPRVHHYNTHRSPISHNGGDCGSEGPL